MKKVFKTTFFITLALILFFVVLIVVFALSFQNGHAGSVGIIGGADGPTAMLITRTVIFETSVFCVLCIGTVVFIISAIGWLITKNK